MVASMLVASMRGGGAGRHNAHLRRPGELLYKPSLVRDLGHLCSPLGLLDERAESRLLVSAAPGSRLGLGSGSGSGSGSGLG